MSKCLKKGAAWLAILLIFGGLNLWGPIRRAAAAPSLSEAILFTEGNAINPTILRMNPDGSQPEQALRALNPAGQRAIPARDGSFLLSFDKGGALVTSAVDGADRIVISDAALQYSTNFAFSPDGTQIAFSAKAASQPKGFNGIYVASADGTGATVLTTPTNNFSQVLLDWGPAGVLMKDRAGTTPTSPQPLYLVDPSTGTATPIGTATWMVTDAKFSPDGTMVAAIVQDGGQARIFTLNADGSGTPAEVVTTPALTPNYLAWSPAGTDLAVSAYPRGVTGGPYGIYTVPAAGGTATLVHSAPAGKQTSYVFWGDVPILQLPTSLTAQSTTITVGEEVTLRATLDPALAGMTITFSVEGTEVGTGVTDDVGVATFTYTPGQSPGSYTYTATFAGDGLYSASADTASLRILALPTSVSITGATLVYDTSVPLTATLSPALAGRTIEFAVDGTVVGSADTDGTGIATITYTATQDAGTHTLTASFAGETDYEPSSGSAEITITPATTSIATSAVTVGFYESVLLQGTLSPALAGKTIAFHVNGSLVGSATTDGTGTASFNYVATVSAGTHSFDASFAGDTNYQASSAGAELTVTSVDGDVSVADISMEYLSTADLEATLSPGAPGRVLTFTVGGAFLGNAITGDGGAATRSYSGSLDAGTYSIDVAFAGDSSIGAAAGTGTLTVTQAPGGLTVSDSTGEFLGTGLLRATLSPAVAGKTVTFSVDGVAVGSDTTNASGQASLSIAVSQSVGTHTITADFAGDANISAASGTGILTITAADGDLSVPGASGTYDAPATLTAILSPALAGKTITFAVDGTEVGSGATDGSGQASTTYTVTQPAGNHTITATFDGDAEVTAATGTGTLTTVAAAGAITVDPATTVFGAPTGLTATLSPALSGRTITFTVNGSPVGTATTNAAGVATLVYAPTQSVGTHTLGASWDGDGYVGPASGTSTLTLSQASGTLSISAAGGEFRSDVTLSATLSPAAAGKTVAFRVNGALVGTGVTDAAGEATYVYHSTETVGTFPLAADFAGDADIGPASDTANLTITQATGTLTVLDASGPFGGTATLRAILSPAVAGKTIAFSVSGGGAGSATTDASGMATVTFTINGTVGTRPIGASFGGDAEITGASGAGTLTVDAASGSIAVTPATGAYAASVTLQATLSPAEAGKVITFQVDGDAVGSGTTDGSGVATATYVIDKPAGLHVVTAAFAGDAEISAASGTGPLTVTQAAGSMTTADATGAYLGTATLQATLAPAMAGKTIAFSVDGSSAGTGITDAAGVASVSYSVSQPVGTYVISASFAGDADISAASNTGTLTVTQASGSVNVAPVSGAYMSNVTLQATLSPADAGKSIDFQVDGASAGTGTTNGAGEATVTYLITRSAGSHTITATFAGDANISADSGTGTLTVTQTTGALAVADVGGDFGASVNLSATLTPNVAGKTVTFTVAGASVGTAVTDITGVATLAYTIAEPSGPHTVTADFAGDGDIAAASGTGTLTVNPAVGTLTVTDQTGSHLSTVTLTATLTPNMSGKTVTFRVNSTPVGSDTTSGAGVATTDFLITLPVGSYSIDVDFPGDAQITASSGTGTLTVTQATGSVSAAAVSGAYKSTVNLTATLTPAAAGRPVSFTVDGADAGTGVTDASGVATVAYPVNLSVGSYNIGADFAGDADITAASDTDFLTVTQATGALSVSDTSGMLGAAVTLSATLTPNVTGKTVAFTVDGAVVGSGTTDAAGVASVNYTIANSVGTHSISADFAGDADISMASGTGTLTVTQAAGIMIADDKTAPFMGSVTLTATLTPALTGKTIDFLVDGVAVGSGTTNAGGAASVAYAVTGSAGIHIITAAFAGDGDISAASDAAALTVTQASGSMAVAGASGALGTPVSLSATLTPGAAGKTVTFAVNGIAAGSGTTDAAGVATVTFTPVLPVGPYTITADFAGDADISAASGSGTLTVTQGTGALTAADRTGGYMSTVVLQATLSPGLAGKTVTFTVDGAAAGSGVTDASGVATTDYLIVNSTGNHTIVADFAGDADLTAASSSGALTVTAATGVLSVANVAGDFGDTVTLSATLTPGVTGKTVTFTVDGVAAGSGTTDAAGVATVDFVIANSGGTYSIDAAFAGDADISAASGSGTLTVSPAAGALAVPGASGAYRSTVVLQATLSPNLAGKSIAFAVDGVAAGTGVTDAGGVATVSYLITNSVGSYTIDAYFAGDVQVAATAGSGTLTVTQATGGMTVAPATGPFKSSVTLTATLTPGVAGKAVDFTVNGAAVGSGVTDAAGVATLAYAADLPAGTYTVDAAFAGDADISAAGASTNLEVTQATGSAFVADAAGVIGTPVVLSATLSPGAAGKVVSFTVDGAPAGSGTTNATGAASVSFTPLLSIGSYSIEASFAGDADISAATDTGTLTVTPASGTMVADDAAGVYMSTVTLSATLSPALAGKTVTFAVDAVAAGSGVTDAAGLATVSYLVVAAAGTHTVTASFAGDADISAATDTADLTVGQATGNLTAANQAGAVGSTVTLSATLAPGVAGKTVSFAVNGVAAGSGVTDAAGVATVNYVPLLPVGTYAIEAGFAGDADISPANGSGTLTVTQGSGAMAVASLSSAYQSTVTLQATLSPALAGKTVTFMVNGAAAGSGVTDAAGGATVAYPIGLSVGTYNIVAAFAGDADITAAGGTGSLTVTQATGSLAVADTAGDFGDTVTLSATLTPGVAGKTVTFTVDGVAAGSGVTDGTGVATASYLITNSAGTYFIGAAFAGDADITAASGSGDLTVSAAAGTLSVADATGAYMSTVTLTATLSPALAGKPVDFTVDGVAVGSGVTGAGGVATVSYQVVNSVGTYTVGASFAGDGQVGAASGSGQLMVNQVAGALAVTAVSGPYKSSVTLTATLAPGVADKTIAFAVDGVAAGSSTTDAAGVATLSYSVDLSVGTYAIDAVFAGDADISMASGSADLTVTQATGAVVVADATDLLGATVTLSATMTPGVAGKTVAFTVDGAAAGSGATDVSGVATVSYTITLPVGTYDIGAAFAGDADISAANGSGSLSVTQATGALAVANLPANYGDTVTLSATLTPAMAGKTVTFTVDGVGAGAGVTDATGLATASYLVINSAGSYTIGAAFAGDSDITAASGTGTLTVSAAPATLTVPDVTDAYLSTVTLSATLSPNLAGKTVTFTVNGVAAGSGVTDGTGVATVSYLVVNSVGTYPIAASFAGDGQATSATGAGTLTVNQAPGSMTVAPVTGTYKSTVNLTATLAPGVAGKTVTFTVNGAAAGSGTTDAAGVVTVAYPADLSVGMYDIVATFAGDADISAASDTDNLTVTQATGSMTVADATGLVGETVTLTATLTPGVTGKTVTFTVDGTNVGSGLTDAGGVATVTYTIAKP
ncbi:MAG TPA: Ig-like domain repeat protein, partial [Symbiobacteriaceae bacterium]|nr:Ig-like domain repeat protein [Symbiobacteriaceae bacterium]